MVLRSNASRRHVKRANFCLIGEGDRVKLADTLNSLLAQNMYISWIWFKPYNPGKRVKPSEALSVLSKMAPDLHEDPYR
jgi:hypothetical protein